MGQTELPQKNKMPHKFTFVWDDNKIENQGEDFHFSNHFENLSQVIYCGTFSEPVSLNGVEVETSISQTWKYKMVYLIFLWDRTSVFLGFLLMSTYFLK